MIVVNIYSGPGSGKSTVAADVFAKLKRMHVNTEMSREFAKDLVWQKSLNLLKDQLKILGEQHHRQWMLEGQCEVCITDSPMLLCCIYNTYYTNFSNFNALALEAHHRFQNLNYFLGRPESFESAGRVEDEEKAKIIDNQIKSFLHQNSILYATITHETASERIIKDVLELRRVLSSGRV